jgi:glycerol-3-phosphate acyltransferase PlsY
MSWVRVVAALLCGYAAGALPFSYAVARCYRVDLRRVGSGTTSPSNVYRVLGFTPALAAGILEVGKGVVGPAVAGPGNVLVPGLAGGLAVFAHIWPPVRYGGGGRGLSTATGCGGPRRESRRTYCWPGGSGASAKESLDFGL